MKTTSIAVAALLSAGAMAHPALHLPRLHLHKRDLPAGAEPVKSWDSGNTHYEEYQVVKTVVLQPGEQPPAEQQQSPAPAPAPAPAPSKAPAAPVVQEKYTAPQNPAPVVQQPAPSPSAASTGSGGSCGADAIGGDASEWANDPCSGGQHILESFNQMRAKWIPSLANSPYTWDATLAANARSTTVDPVTVDASGTKHNEGGATQMNHQLNSGSMAQCIAAGDGTTESGGLTPFEQAVKLWVCEEPQGDVGCNGPSNGGDTGHAEIIKSTTYTKVGCYYMNAAGPASWTGEWTCDFA